MSRGRPRHQSSRRKTYSARQRELREREARAARADRAAWESGRVTAVEIDESIDGELPPVWPLPLTGRSPAG